MKKASKIFIVGILLCLSFSNQAQHVLNPYPDTVRIKTDAQKEVVFSFYRMSDKEEYMTDDLWKSMLNIMESAVESSPNQEGIKVSYRKIENEEGDEEAKVMVDKLESEADIYLIGKEGMQEIHSDRIDFAIYQPKMSISFSLDDISDLEGIKELSVESVWEQVNKKFENQGKRNLYAGNGIFKYGKANLDGIVGEAGSDNIELSAGVGIGFYRDRFAPDLNFKIAVNFPDRLGNDDLQFGLLFTQQYFFSPNAEQEFDLDVNGFLTGFFSKQFSDNYKIGIGAGMLIQQNGDFYQDNTFKFSLYTERRDSKVNLTPELIFTDNFKQVIPALKFGLSF